MSVQIQRSIVTRKRVDVSARCTPKEWIVSSACQIRTDGSIKRDANYVIVTTRDQLVSRVICIRANVCAAKGSLAANAINVRVATSDTQAVIVAIAIAMVQSLPTTPNQLLVMTMGNVRVKRLSRVKNAINALNQRLGCRSSMQSMGAQSVSASADQVYAGKVISVGASSKPMNRAVLPSNTKISSTFHCNPSTIDKPLTTKPIWN